ncbi:TolB-like translocation protein [Alkaliphilus serpentinus]|uniref:Uncharacterized protein n=1 Tax=Alkaliphilus serpentinus TaxID=1482731 RepID=A0A833HQZ9_9FIRM|nr:hypothetical protein [Alkaliphilus serpentinus]KAB3532509.1 hypothetical protein F8153_02410 [Alkaliphilus serpentinus]
MNRLRVLLIFILVVIITGCNNFRLERPLPNNENKRLVKVEAFDELANPSGVKAENGRFYFIALEDEGLNYYSFSLVTNKVQNILKGIGGYEALIPMKDKQVVYIDVKGDLKYLNNHQEITIDKKITGVNYPNILVSADKTMILYTREIDGQQSVFSYDVDTKEKRRIIPSLEKTDYENFMLSRLSHTGEYFLLSNRLIYDTEGNYLAAINTTSARWAPNDRWLAYIMVGEGSEDINIGEIKTKLGKSFCIFSMEKLEERELFHNDEGFIDPIDVIQWSEDSKVVAISAGKVIKSSGYLEGIDYDKILVYQLDADVSNEIKDMDYNFYQILFDTLIFGNNLGERQPAVIVGIEEKNQMVIEEPLLINNKDMFVITHEDKGYLINGKNLMEIDKEGNRNVIYTFPWEVDEVYYEEVNKLFVILDSNKEVYLLK